MGQKEVMDILNKFHKEALSIREISERLKNKITISNINRAVKEMEKYGEVESISLDVYEAREKYGKKIKRRVKIYCVKGLA